MLTYNQMGSLISPWKDSFSQLEAKRSCVIYRLLNRAQPLIFHSCTQFILMQFSCLTSQNPFQDT